MLFDRVPQCPKCKSLDVSWDIATGKITCSKCGSENIPDRFNFEEHILNLRDKEIGKKEDEEN